MMEAARDTSFVLISAMLEVILAKVAATRSGDFSRSYINKHYNESGNVAYTVKRYYNYSRV